MILTAFLILGSAQVSLARGLNAFCSFRGNAEDLSPRGNDAEVRSGALTKELDGEAESAHALNGEDDYLLIPHSENLCLNAQATFSLWRRHEQHDTEDTYLTLFEKTGPEQEGCLRYGIRLIGIHRRGLRRSS